jgi:exonuclease VII small subunit
MNTEEIVSTLEQERDRLTQAINALTASRAAGKRQGRKAGRRLSAASKKKISDAMRKTWAARKRKEKSA